MILPDSLRFETKPNSSPTDQTIIWGPWRSPMQIVSLKAILSGSAGGPCTRTARIEIRNVNDPMQQFLQAGGFPVTAASTIMYVTCHAGAGPSITHDQAGTELSTPYCAVPLPPELVLLPGYVIVLTIDGADTGDVLAFPVLCLHEAPVFEG